MTANRDADNSTPNDAESAPTDVDIPGLDLLANVLRPKGTIPLKPAGSNAPGERPSPLFAVNMNFQNFGPLGEGGLGVVWSVRDLSLNRDIALKQMRGEQSQRVQARQRFIREARITGLLEHPSIIPVHALSTGATPFYTMRLVRGSTLQQAIASMHELRKEGADVRADLRRLLTVLVRIGEAIAYAHSKGVIHRDLKPANIILGPFGEVFVLDWGLAKLMETTEESLHLLQGPLADEPEETTDGQIVGTVAYMAPEQAGGKAGAVGAHTDVYGLGAILYQILTGYPPHRPAPNETLQQLLLRIASAPAPTPDFLNAQAPRRLVAICNRAMAFGADARYPLVQDFIDDINRSLAGDAVTAMADRWHDRAVRLLMRRPLTVMGVLTGIAALFVIVIAQVAFVTQHHRFAMERSANQVRAQLRGAAEQTQSELVAVVQVLEYSRDIWAATLADETPDDITQVSRPARKYLLESLFALANRKAIYIDAAQFDSEENLIAQVALDESISPFIAARKTDFVPPYLRDLVQLARAKPDSVHFGSVQVAGGKSRLIVPIATAITSGGRYRGVLAVHVDLVGCVVGAMLSSVRSAPVFLCLYDADGKPLLEFDDQSRVSIGTGSTFSERFPALAALQPTEQSKGNPIHVADSHSIVASRRLYLSGAADDAAAPSLLVVMGVSEHSMYEEGDAIRRSWQWAVVAAMSLSAIVMLAAAYFLVRLRDPRRQFDGM